MSEPMAVVPSEGVTPSRIDELLTGRLGCGAPLGGQFSKVFYDTFDGRLFRAGLVLEHEQVEGRGWLRLRTVGSSTATVQTACTVVPHRVADLADGRLRAALQDPSSGRALLPILSTRSTTRTYRRLAGEGKTVARVVVAAPVAVGTDGTERALDPVVTIVGVRGYDDHRATVESAIREAVGEQLATDPLLRAAGALGVQLGVDPADTDVELSPDRDADEAVGLILARLARVMTVTEAGVREAWDTEFLHDFRVAVRRARTIVRAAAGVLDEELRTELADGLKWLGDVTTPVRDLDVQLEELDGADDGDLGPLVALLRDDRVAARRVMVSALDSPRYRELRAALARTSTPGGGPGKGRSEPVGPWAAARILAAHDKLQKAGRTALKSGERAADGDREDLHTTRKRGKRLRYLIDSFASLYPSSSVADAVKELKGFQDILGEVQDAAVHVEMLESAARRLDSTTSPSTFMAIGALIERRRRQGDQAAAKFAKAFATFRSNRRRFGRRWRIDVDSAEGVRAR